MSDRRRSAGDGLAEILKSLAVGRHGVRSLSVRIVGGVVDPATGTPLTEPARWQSTLEAALESLDDAIRILLPLTPLRGAHVNHLPVDECDTTVELDVERQLCAASVPAALDHVAGVLQYWIERIDSYASSDRLRRTTARRLTTEVVGGLMTARTSLEEIAREEAQ